MTMAVLDSVVTSMEWRVDSWTRVCNCAWFDKQSLGGSLAAMTDVLVTSDWGPPLPADTRPRCTFESKSESNTPGNTRNPGTGTGHGTHTHKNILC